jgi:hypothetical protein
MGAMMTDDLQIRLSVMQRSWLMILRWLPELLRILVSNQYGSYIVI